MSPAELGATVGFYGKLPARGDFVRAGLPRDFVECWDGWWQRMLAGSRAALAEAWLPAWLEAPIWRFVLPSGCCGAGAVVGTWMPSVDRAGRHFPLTLAAVADAHPSTLAVAAAGFLDGAEQAGLLALETDLDPEALEAHVAAAARMPAGPLPELLEHARPGVSWWWTEGSPLVAPQAVVLDALPSVPAFVRMLDDGSARPGAADQQGSQIGGEPPPDRTGALG